MGELTELPQIRKVTDPLAVRTRFTKSQKRQLSLCETVQAQVNSLELNRPKKSKMRSRIQSQTAQTRMERVESSQTGTASQPIDVDDEFNAGEDPLEIERQRRRQPPSSASTSLAGWAGWLVLFILILALVIIII